MYEAINQTTVYQNNKSLLLKTSCLIGFIFTGITILTGLFLIVITGAPGVFRLFPEINFYVSVAGGKISLSFAIISLILPMIAFFGVVLLWQQLKIGYWIFLISKLILVALPFLLVDINANELFMFVQPMLILTVVLLILFGLNYKKLY